MVMMSSLWSFLESLVREAKSATDYKKDLLLYVTRHYSEHEADGVAANIQRMSPQNLQRYLDQRYVDPKINSIVADMIDTATGAHPDKVGKGRGVSRPTYSTSSSSSDKGSGDHDPIPQRPGQDGPNSPLFGKPSKVVAPGEKPVHDVGSAGQHKPKDQTSVSAGISAQKMQPGQTRSGLVASQKEVDRLTRAGEGAKADALARRLGIPTSAERTVTGDDGNKRITVWSPDRVLRFMDPDHNPKGDAERRAASAKDQPIGRIDLIKHGLLQRQGPGVNKPNFDGTVIGQRWKPHGQSYMKNTARPDGATGNFAYGKTLVDPSKTGAEMVWDGNDWIPGEQFDAISSKEIAKRAWRAGQHPPTRGKHSGGTPVSNVSPDSIPRHMRQQQPSAPKPNDDFEDDRDTDPDINV